jgi:TPR repeat protein
MSERKLLFMMKPEQLHAFLCLQRDAEAGDGAAACRLGDMYREGLGGLRYSPRQTYHWYARSAMAGDANGQNNLGACYEHALGCAQSYVKAAKWYRLAAAQELNTAFMNLGYCYLYGRGVPRDKVEALRLFRLAVEGGEDRAQQEVERLESDGDLRVLQPVPADTQRARPCVLTLGSVPPDGSPERLQTPGTAQVSTVSETSPSETGSAEDDTNARPVLMHEDDDPDATASTGGSVEFVDETQPGRHFGLVGGVDGPTEDELFPIFAEGGLKPEDLVDGVAERYAEYVNARDKSGCGREQS